ncbi:MAG: thiamine phosphate synthase [Terriglobales bacterium]
MLLYYITDRHQLPGDERRRRECLLARIAAAVRAGVDFIQLRERDLPVRELEAIAREAAAIVRSVNEQCRVTAGHNDACHPDRPTAKHDCTCQSEPIAERNRTCHPEERSDEGPMHSPANQKRRAGTSACRLLINSRVDVALAAGADGVHLRSDDISAADARAIWSKAENGRWKTENGIFAVSCHTPAEVRRAEADGADFAVFAPVFEKTTAPQRAGVGLETLREACSATPAAPNVEGVGAGRMPVLALGGVTLENARACLAAGAAGIAAIRLFQTGDIEEIVAALRDLAPRPINTV